MRGQPTEVGVAALLFRCAGTSGQAVGGFFTWKTTLAQKESRRNSHDCAAQRPLTGSKRIKLIVDVNLPMYGRH